MEQQEQVVVLDAGRKDVEVVGPEYICCALSYSFYRG